MRKTTVKDVRDITSFEELQAQYSIGEVVAALHAKEMQRMYHKTAYLNRQERKIAIEAALKARGITVEDLLKG